MKKNRMKGIALMVVVLVLLFLASVFVIANQFGNRCAQDQEYYKGKCYDNVNVVPIPEKVVLGLCGEGWIIQDSQCIFDYCAFKRDSNGKILTSEKTYETQFQCNGDLIKIPSGTIPDQKICPQVCTALWQLVPASGGYTCVYNTCGSGCGADNVRTFISKDSCYEAALKY